MRFALSTNWCNLRITSGREIAEKAKSLGFDALELGFHTTDAQAAEIVKCGVVPVESIHAFCPVPISAPQGYPELYQLASFDDEARAMARFQVRKNVEFAASVGASAVVLHAGRIKRGWLFAKRRSEKMIDIFKKELDTLRPCLEKHKVTLGLENMPYAVGFPDANEITAVVGDWVKQWFDTGHAHVLGAKPSDDVIGMHINDSNGGDDHLPPGEGKVDFTALAPTIRRARYLVFEPNTEVTEAALAKGLAFISGKI